jgi:hypothetical protein
MSCKPVPATTAGVFIGEAALTMIQNVDYEVPYLRKQMSKCSQQMADAERRHAEYVRSAAQCATNYKKVGLYRDSMKTAGDAARPLPLRHT